MWRRGYQHERLLLFDFDGVIADSLEVWHRMLLALVPDDVGQRLVSREAFLDCFGVNAWRGMRAYGCRRRDVARIVPRLEGAAPKALVQVEPFPAIVAVVNALAAQYPCAIVTSNHGPSVAAWCVEHGLRGLLQVDGVEVSRSKVRKIRRLRRRLRPRHLLYIGDTAGDFHEARRAQAEFIGVAWGWHGAEHLRQLGATVAADPQMLKELLSGERAASN